MAVLGGVVDGSLAEVVLVVGLGPVEDEPLDDAQVTLGGREVERRGAVAVAGRHGQRLLQDLSREERKMNVFTMLRECQMRSTFSLGIIPNIGRGGVCQKGEEEVAWTRPNAKMRDHATFHPYDMSVYIVIATCLREFIHSKDLEDP